MNDESKKYLTDILGSILSIEEYTGNSHDFTLYQSDKMKRRAVERELEIIGEAVSQLKKSNPAIKISDSRKIIDLRNKVIHAYDSVDDHIIWGIVIQNLPVLKKEIEALLNND